MVRKRAKRVKVAAGDSSMLTPAQREALEEEIRCALEDGGQIPWRSMTESAAFADVTYETLRREGKAVIRQLSKQNNPSIKRPISDLDEAIAEPEPAEDRVGELEALLAHKNQLLADEAKQVEALRQQLAGLQAVVTDKDEQLAEGEKLQKQVEALQQCISELSAIIANKDVLLAEATARYDALKGGICQLASDG
ncbi:unnamed protein product [Phytophthora lilii]|uniref:Unnamed protein product n=1 Tax=Phytophthora lilii TaxID=2077276 RepID=A0A9W6U8H3_9STRA|nr:unnamed protein product [Phytophthora lilii]